MIRQFKGSVFDLIKSKNNFGQSIDTVATVQASAGNEHLFLILSIFHYKKFLYKATLWDELPLQC